jgi:hypothetical protein
MPKVMCEHCEATDEDPVCHCGSVGLCDKGYGPDHEPSTLQEVLLASLRDVP